MKMAIPRAIFAVAAACIVCVLVSVPEAHAAASLATAADHLSGYHEYAAIVLAVGLDALRAQHTDLQTRAAAKIAEVKDGMPAEAVRAIETAHGEIVRDIASVATAITTEERALPKPPAPPTAAEIQAAERTRAAEIMSLSTRHAMPATFAGEHIAGGTPIDAVRTIVLDHVAKEADKKRISPRVGLGQDEGDTLRNALSAAIMLRASPGSIRPDNEANRTLIESARNFRGMKLMEMGRVFTEEVTGQRVRGLGQMEMAGFLLGMPVGMGTRAGALSTSDFPNILANVVNKRLRDAYQTAPQTWKAISRQSNNPDFKAKSVVQLSNLPKFKEIKEGGEYKIAALSDGAASYALATYGNIVPITRQTLINDDLGAFERLPLLQGRAAAETEASIFWALFNANAGVGATMEDGHPLFDAANHANYTSVGTDISVAALDIGRTALRMQVGFGADPEPLNLSPKYLLVSPAKETKAQMFLASITATKGGDINPFANSLQQITEARLSGNGWYLLGDPAQIDTIEYAYLDGEEGLYTETRFGFEVDGIEVKGRLDFAAHIIDYRGFYKNAGA